MTGIGDVLETLRRSCGMTQEELCSKADVTQAALSRYENDLRAPEGEVLDRLAQALGVSTRFLLRDHAALGAIAVDAHMRRQRSVKASLWRKLEARLNAHRMHISALFEEVSLRSDQSVPTFDPVDTAPAQAALMVRAQWRLPVGPVRNMTRWLESAGCVIFEEDFGTSRIDGLSQWVGDHPVLLINGSMPVDRKRLTLAHELGHLVLHNGLPSDDPEREANEFATEFLMPAHVIKPDLKSVTIGRLRDLKQVWGVSMQALFERANSLGLVTSAERQRFYKSMNARGWKTAEPESDRLAPEVPELVAAIGETLHSKGLTDAEIAELAGFAEESPHNPFSGQGPRLRVLRA